MIGVGAKLEYEVGSSWEEIPEVRSVNFPAFNVTSVDKTNLGNTDYGMTYEPGMIDPDMITFECIYTKDVYANVLMPLIRETVHWRVSDPSGMSPVTSSCDGFITKVNVTMAANDLMVIQGEIKLTGVPVVS